MCMCGMHEDMGLNWAFSKLSDAMFLVVVDFISVAVFSCVIDGKVGKFCPE